MGVDCENCGDRNPARQHHLHLANREVVELALCEHCRHRFVVADWVRAVV